MVTLRPGPWGPQLSVVGTVQVCFDRPGGSGTLGPFGVSHRAPSGPRLDRNGRSACDPRGVDPTVTHSKLPAHPDLSGTDLRPALPGQGVSAAYRHLDRKPSGEGRRRSGHPEPCGVGVPWQYLGVSGRGTTRTIRDLALGVTPHSPSRRSARSSAPPTGGWVRWHNFNIYADRKLKPKDTRHVGDGGGWFYGTLRPTDVGSPPGVGALRGRGRSPRALWTVSLADGE